MVLRGWFNRGLGGFQMVFWSYKAKTGGIKVVWRYGYGVEVECRYGLPFGTCFQMVLWGWLIGGLLFGGIKGFRLSRKHLLE